MAGCQRLHLAGPGIREEDDVSDAQAKESLIRTAVLPGQPRGLLVIYGTALAMRISFYGVSALLTLYMVQQLFQPGHIQTVWGLGAYRDALQHITGALTTEALATQTFGLFLGLAYFTPLFGGFVGDRLLGRRRSVILGCVLIAVGYAGLAFERFFLPALLLLILGTGFTNGNLIAQVGGLFTSEEERSTRAMQIYYAMVNLGYCLGPLVTGAVAQVVGWRYAFGLAACAMLVGLCVYLVGLTHLPQDPTPDAAIERTTLTGPEWRKIAVLLLLLPSLTVYWIVDTQGWDTYNLWVTDHVNLEVLGWHVPAAWMQSWWGIASVLLVPVVLYTWKRLAAAGREPDDVGKLMAGCLVTAGFVACDGCSTLIFPGPHQVPLAWILVTSLGTAIGYLNLEPVAAALFTTASPKSVRALMVGVYFLSIFLGSLIAGWLGGLYGSWSATSFWLLHSGILIAAGLLIPVIGRPLRRSTASWKSLPPDSPTTIKPVESR
jgi:proton-dependent oligopeptide transporter, POT family